MTNAKVKVTALRCGAKGHFHSFVKEDSALISLLSRLAFSFRAFFQNLRHSLNTIRASSCLRHKQEDLLSRSFAPFTKYGFNPSNFLCEI